MISNSPTPHAMAQGVAMLGEMNSHTCGPECRYRSLYEGTQASLTDMAAKQAAALGRVGRLRKSVVQALKTSAPADFETMERQTGRLADADDQMISAAVAHIVRQSASSCQIGPPVDVFAELRTELSKRGVQVHGDDPVAWVKQLAVAPPTKSIWDEHLASLRDNPAQNSRISPQAGSLWDQARSFTSAGADGWYAVQGQPADTKPATKVRPAPTVKPPQAPKPTQDTKQVPPTTGAGVLLEQQVGDTAPYADAARGTTAVPLAEAQMSPAGTTSAPDSPQDQAGNAADAPETGTQHPEGETTADGTGLLDVGATEHETEEQDFAQATADHEDDTNEQHTDDDDVLAAADPSLAFDDDAPLVGAGFDDSGFGIDAFDSNMTDFDDTFPAIADSGFDDLFPEIGPATIETPSDDSENLPQAAAATHQQNDTKSAQANGASGANVETAAAERAEDKPVRLAPATPVRVELFPQSNAGRTAGKKKKPKVSALPPERFEVPADLTGGDIGNSRRNQITAAITASRPVFTSDLAALVGDASVIERWQEEQRADGSQVRFLTPKSRHGQRGALVMPVGSLRKTIDATGGGWWIELLDRYRGAKLYEAAVVGWRCGAQVLSYMVDKNDPVVTFRIRGDRGLTGVILVCDDDVSETSPARHGIVTAVDSLLRDPFELVVILATSDKALEPLVSAVDTEARQRNWRPPCPIVAARSWEWADGTGSLVEIVS